MSHDYYFLILRNHLPNGSSKDQSARKYDEEEENPLLQPKITIVDETGKNKVGSQTSHLNIL